ncbi:unnamed protein product [Ceratitis capitata]|uniref:(Mediterranean fruit fly) hypothetical protein n=1 Tax=Ceratitis capitata TaxID=7213 RepID=A0A811VCR6_CERCA|nr:unnamed protein product [Ceratitis capitata]
MSRSIYSWVLPHAKRTGQTSADLSIKDVILEKLANHPSLLEALSLPFSSSALSPTEEEEKRNTSKTSHDTNWSSE